MKKNKWYWEDSISAASEWLTFDLTFNKNKVLKIQIKKWKVTINLNQKIIKPKLGLLELAKSGTSGIGKTQLIRMYVQYI